MESSGRLIRKTGKAPTNRIAEENLPCLPNL
jgi:hypothetical protein